MAMSHENEEWTARVWSVDDSVMPPPFNICVKKPTLASLRAELKAQGLRYPYHEPIRERYEKKFIELSRTN